MTYESEEQVRELVRRVEGCTFPLEDWHHDTHLAVLTWYLTRHPRDEATRRMRATIVRFNAHHRIATTRERGYHETLTLAWIALVHGLLEGAAPGATFAERLRDVLEAFGDRRVLRRHYSRDRMMSWEARLGWVEPDLLPLEGDGAQPPPGPAVGPLGVDDRT